MSSITPLKTASVKFFANGIYRGVVTSRFGNLVNIRVPRLSGDMQYKNVSVVGGNPVGVGDVVAVGFVEGIQDDLIVLGAVRDQLPGPSSGGDPGSDTVIDQVSTSLARSVKYVVQATHSSGFTVTEILAVHDGATVSFTEYAHVATAGVADRLADYDAQISGSVLQLLANPSLSGVTFVVSRLILNDS